MLVFSATTNGFYETSVNRDIPSDAVEITQELHKALMEGQASGKIVSAKADGLPTLIDPRPIVMSAAELCDQIDIAADTARAAVVGDPTRTIEYERAAAEAAQFKAAGYPVDAVPRTVAAWAINGRTAQQAADSILAEAAAYTEALYVIRETRLAAKEQIRTLMAAGEVEQAQQLAEQTVAAIEAAVAGVGNAAA